VTEKTTISESVSNESKTTTMPASASCKIVRRSQSQPQFLTAFPAVMGESIVPNLASIKPIKRVNGKAKALNVAKFLVYLAACEEEPDFLSHLRLQKLLYYVQGWSLANRNKAMFTERIEAWAHGPVVRDVYAVLSSFGRRPILVEDIGEPADLTEEEMAFIQSVWESYKQFSASSLREMTHNESPWLEARKGLGPADRCEEEITVRAMKDFFSQPSKK
jgi:uncharacterized phage-associated protein